MLESALPQTDDMGDFILVGANDALLDDDAKKKKEYFLEKLQEDEGLVIEYLEMDEVQFFKVTAPVEVLRRGAYLLRLRLPIKVLDDGKEKPKEDDKPLTAVFSQDKSYLFDEDPKFTPQEKTRIVSFILNRARFSDDPDNVLCLWCQEIDC